MSNRQLILYFLLILVGGFLVGTVAAGYVVQGKVGIGLLGAFLMGNGLRPFAEILVKKLKNK